MWCSKDRSESKTTPRFITLSDGFSASVSSFSLSASGPITSTVLSWLKEVLMKGKTSLNSLVGIGSKIQVDDEGCC